MAFAENFFSVLAFRCCVTECVSVLMFVFMERRDCEKANAQIVCMLMLLLCRRCCGYFFFRFKLRVDFFTRFSLSSLSVCLYVAFNIELAVSCHCTLPINVLYTLSTAFTHSTIQKSEKNRYM